jgi:hypothetical protein
MNHADYYKKEIVKSESIAAINATIGLCVINVLQEILETVKKLEQAWVPPQRVDVVGHNCVSQEVQTAVTIKANKTRKGPKVI